jgi:hypothetical protein
MIQYLGKNNFKHKSLELSSKGRKIWERAKRQGEGVLNSRCTTGEGTFSASLLSCWWDDKLQHVNLRPKTRALRFLKTNQFSQIGGSEAVHTAVS